MSCIKVPKILMPNKKTNLYKWSVVACDQYTSQLEYWQDVEKIVGEAPSTLNIILPEVYLEDDDVKYKISDINKKMYSYLNQGILKELPEGFVLTERFVEEDTSRKGLVVTIDLECYEYEEGVHTVIRPTEKTVIERIPPRLAVRKDAPIEVPHIMILIDDPEHTVIEPLYKNRHLLPLLYESDLMKNGGHLKGWFVPKGNWTDEVIEKIDGFLDRELFNKKYDVNDKVPMLCCAVGDGNHSLATAKAHWNEVKKGLKKEELDAHPARFCLCELVNIHDESLLIEPIHRVLFHVDIEEVLESAMSYYIEKGCGCKVIYETKKGDESDHTIPFCTENGEGSIIVSNPQWGMVLGTLQAFLDYYMPLHPAGKLDYIHGSDVTRELGMRHSNIGFIMPSIEKKELFHGIISDGVLPRKTFSMGEAYEKRYYMECRSILPK